MVTNKKSEIHLKKKKQPYSKSWETLKKETGHLKKQWVTIEKDTNKRVGSL